MRKIFDQLSLLFSNLSLAIEIKPDLLPLVTSLIAFWVFSLLLFFQNSLTPDLFSISLFPGLVVKQMSLKLIFSIATQFIVVGIPFLVLGKKGVSAYFSNLALIQFLCFGLAVVGFLYSSAFWPLYKVLPISGLTAKAVFEAIFLLYPALIIVIFRYVMLWMIATKAGASSKMVILMCFLHLVLSAGVWFLGGVL